MAFLELAIHEERIQHCIESNDIGADPLSDNFFEEYPNGSSHLLLLLLWAFCNGRKNGIARAHRWFETSISHGSKGGHCIGEVIGIMVDVRLDKKVENRWVGVATAVRVHKSVEEGGGAYIPIF